MNCRPHLQLAHLFDHAFPDIERHITCISIVLRDFSDIDKLNLDNQFNCSSLFHQTFYFSSCLFDISISIQNLSNLFDIVAFV